MPSRLVFAALLCQFSVAEIHADTFTGNVVPLLAEVQAPPPPGGFGPQVSLSPDLCSPPMPSRLVFAALLCQFSVAEIHADTFTGNVVIVLDGSALEVLVGRTPRRIRLAGIAVPEKVQALGARAKQALLNLVGGQKVEVDGTRPTSTAAQSARLSSGAGTPT